MPTVMLIPASLYSVMLLIFKYIFFSLQCQWHIIEQTNRISFFLFVNIWSVLEMNAATVCLSQGAIVVSVEQSKSQSLFAPPPEIM